MTKLVKSIRDKRRTKRPLRKSKGCLLHTICMKAFKALKEPIVGIFKRSWSQERGHERPLREKQRMAVIQPDPTTDHCYCTGGLPQTNSSVPWSQERQHKLPLREKQRMTVIQPDTTTDHCYRWAATNKTAVSRR